MTLKLGVTRKIGPFSPAVINKFRLARSRHRLAVGALDAAVGEGAERRVMRGIGVLEVEAFGQRDLEAPGLAGDPAVFGEIIGGRADRVGRARPDVAAAAAVEIDGDIRGSSKA